MQNHLSKKGSGPQQPTAAPCSVSDDPKRKKERKEKDSSQTLFDRSYIWMNKLFKLSPAMVPFSSESGGSSRDLEHLIKLTIRKAILDFSPELQSFIENIQIFYSNADMCGTGDETD